MALILGLIGDISAFVIVLLVARVAYKLSKRYYNILNKPQNGEVMDAESAERLALLFLISEKDDEVESFIKEHIHLLSTDTVVKLTAHLEQLRIMNCSYDESRLKVRFDKLEEMNESVDDEESLNVKGLQK